MNNVNTTNNTDNMTDIDKELQAEFQRLNDDTQTNSLTDSPLNHIMSTVNNVKESLTINDVDGEVKQLLQVAQDEIGRFEATDEWLARELHDLPTVQAGHMTIAYLDDRKYIQYKIQSLSDSFWVIAIKQVQYHLSINYDLLSAAFANWINDNGVQETRSMGQKVYNKVEVKPEDLIPIAKDYIVALQDLNIVDVNLVRKVVRLQAGNNITTKVYEIDHTFKSVLDDIITDLRSKVSYKRKPLQFMPKDWVDMKTGISEHARLKLVTRSKIKPKKITKPVLDAVNKLQRVKFTIAPCILEAAKDMRMNRLLYGTVGGFSKKELTKEAFDMYTELQVLSTGPDSFYFPVTMDTRGRMYYRGGLLTPQGTDLCKAAFQFAEYLPLGAYGLRAIYLHTANVCGMDKASNDDRITWIKANWPRIMRVETHCDVRDSFKGASVFQALVACKELQRLSALDGEWSEKTSNLVCHRDGTCNGLQHMAAITGDRATAEAVNCTQSGNKDTPADVYGLVAKHAEQHVTASALQLVQKYNRNMAKEPVMTISYGATEGSVQNTIGKFLVTNHESIVDSKEITEGYVQAISETAGAVTQLTEALVTRVDYALLDGAKKFVWRTADGFLAATKYEDIEDMVVRVGLFYTRKRNMGVAPIDIRKSSQAMAPNFIHSIDGTHLRMVINECDHSIVAVHDSIGSHPCNYFHTAKVIRETFSDLHTDYDALNDLCRGMRQPLPKFPRKGEYSAKEALKSAYIFS